jgi:hypothetical protein
VGDVTRVCQFEDDGQPATLGNNGKVYVAMGHQFALDPSPLVAAQQTHYMVTTGQRLKGRGNAHRRHATAVSELSSNYRKSPINSIGGVFSSKAPALSNNFEGNTQKIAMGWGILDIKHYKYLNVYARHPMCHR